MAAAGVAVAAASSTSPSQQKQNQRCPSGCVLCGGGDRRARAAAPAAARRVLRAALADGNGRNVDWLAVACVAQATCLPYPRARALLSAPLLRAPRNADGPRSALGVAVEEDRQEIVALLLARGADPNSVRVWCDDTPLVICAGFRGNIHVASLLLAYGAHVDGIGIPASSPSSSTSPNLSPRFSSSSLLQNSSSSSGLLSQLATPARSAEARIENTLSVATPPSALNVAIQNTDRSHSRRRRRSHSDLEENGGDQKIQLDLAPRPTMDVVKSLTALGVAAHRGHLSLVRLLLCHGADVHHVEAVDGCSVLHLAAQGSQSGSVEHMHIVETLIAHGANPAARDFNGNTPARAAFLAGDQPLAILLYLHTQARTVRTPAKENSFAREASSLVPTDLASDFISSRRGACQSVYRSAILNNDVESSIRAAKRVRLFCGMVHRWQ